MMAAAVLNDNDYRILKNLAARGVSNAAVGLSEMVGREIRVRTSEVSMLSIDQVSGLLDSPEVTVVGVYLAIGGDVRGHILLLFSPREAMGLVDMLMGLPSGSTTTMGTMERSALGEVGNLTGSFFLNALGEATQLCSQPSPPAVVVDMGAAVLDIPLVSLAQSAEEALVIKTIFQDNERQIKAAFLVMPDLQSLKKILGVLENRWPSV